MMPRPMNATVLMSISLLLSGRLLRGVGGEPAEAGDGARSRLVLAGDPAAVAQGVEPVEDERGVDLAGARLVAARVVADLDMRDAGEVPLDGGDEVSLHHLHVVDVVLKVDVFAPSLRDEVERLLGVAEEEAWDVARVDGLDEELDSLRAERAGGEAQIVDKGRVDALGIGVRAGNAGEAVELGAPERLCVLDGLAHSIAELAHAIRQAGDAALSFGPVAGGQVVEHLREARRGELLCEELPVVGVWEEVLHGLEPGLPRRVEAVEDG